MSTVCGNARRSVKFLQKPFDSPRGHSYIAPTVGAAALCGRKAIRFSRVSRAYASWPKGWGESGSVFLEAKASAVTIYLLFDNRIGRKRNVDGGVLADRPLKGRSKRHSDGHVKEFIAPLASAGGGCARNSSRVVTSREKVLIQLESLILAQNERWRQA
jgi:hypothetical protein